MQAQAAKFLLGARR